MTDRDALLSMTTIWDEGKILTLQFPTMTWWSEIMERLKGHIVYISGIPSSCSDRNLYFYARSDQMCCNTTESRGCEIKRCMDEEDAVIYYFSEKGKYARNIFLLK